MGGGKGSLFLFIFKENWAVRVAVPFLNDPQQCQSALCSPIAPAKAGSPNGT